MADQPIKLNPEDYLPPGDGSRLAYTTTTRTPIEFTKLKGDSGGYTGPNLLLNLLSHIVNMQLPGSIQVDPYAADNQDVSKTIRHESVHSLLGSDLGGVDPSSIDSYPQVLDAIKRGNRGGDPLVESPAYAAAFEMNKTPMEPSARDSFVQQFASKLALKDADKAKKYKLLSKD